MSFSYRYNDEIFTETYTFPGDFETLYSQKKKWLDRLFFLQHIATGISYYKAFIPNQVSVNSGVLTKDEAEFFEKFYQNGLGEFLCRNNLPFPDLHFPYDDSLKEEELPITLEDKIFVPVGGGKDSAVSLELLKDFSYPLTPVSAGMAPAIQRVSDTANVGNHLMIKRELSPRLLELNKTGKFYNGHIPVTGVLAFMLMTASALYGYRFVAMSNERSANVGNREYRGRMVNHQWSKSLEFEQDFGRITQKLLPNFRYFSLLRPLSELKIASLFAQKCQAYFPVFTSCNKAFKIQGRLQSWCLNCDKCRFVFLALAPFVPKKELLSIFGKNLLEDETQFDGFSELLGLKNFKPFECVGEVEESRLALYLLSRKNEWKETKFIRQTIPFLTDNFEKIYRKVMSVSEDHFLPKEFKNVLYIFEK